MLAPNRSRVIRHMSREDTIREFQDIISQFEQRYGLSSEEMLSALQRDERSDDADIARWMVYYRGLQHITR